MSREISFNKNAVCDNCGAKGAFDFMGDLLCAECADGQSTKVTKKKAGRKFCVWIKPYYFKVRLFDTLADLGKHFKQSLNAKKKLYGRTIPLESSRCLGEIYLSLEGLEVDVAAHEAFHATMLWARREKKSPEFYEEEIAQVAGDLTKQLTDKL